jgi:hypothetical protein
MSLTNAYKDGDAQKQHEQRLRDMDDRILGQHYPHMRTEPSLPPEPAPPAEPYAVRFARQLLSLPQGRVEPGSLHRARALISEWESSNGADQ